MKEGYLSTYFDGVVAKRLSSVEANLEKSNQHEFNGVSALKKLLGDDRLTDCLTHFVWLGEENEGITENSYVTWYDSRENHPTRSEYRLYFRDNAVMSAAQAGDLLIIAKSPRGQLMIVVAGANSTVENQLLWLFGVSNQLGESFQFNDYQSDDGVQIDFAARYILEELGIEVEEPETDRLDALLEQFNGVFPTTVVFSKFARETLPEVIPQDDPDGALLAWMDREEKLFRRMERHIVADRLRNGFVENDDEVDVNGFLKFSLSVQNRRKSRAGYALENHLEAVFTACEIRYDSQAVTENRSKPDFLFPGLSEYKDSQFPSEVTGVPTFNQINSIGY